jgi:molecular chaperone HtpG
VAFNRENRVIVVDDSGDGMGRTQMVDLFTKVGASASELAGADTATAQSLIGTFGIGVISYFMLADEYVVQTKRVDEAAIGLRFSTAMLDGESAEDVEATREATGTTLQIPLLGSRRGGPHGIRVAGGRQPAPGWPRARGEPDHGHPT